MITADDRERIESFRTYVEDSLATDDRYGPAARNDDPQGRSFVSRWTVAPACYFEVAVTYAPAQVAISFLTDDQSRIEAVESAIAESGQSTDEYVRDAFRDAGLDWSESPVEHFPRDQMFAYSTNLRLDELADLESDEIRDRTLRILEGFMIAFAPALAVGDVGD